VSNYSRLKIQIISKIITDIYRIHCLTNIPIIDLHGLPRYKIISVEIMRGLAALSVALFHFSGSHPNLHDGLSVFKLVMYGGEGVTVFFVISGFVMCIAAQRKVHKALNFWIDRIFRIYPTYLCALAVALMGLLLTSIATGKQFDNLLVGYDFADFFGNLFLISNLYLEPRYANGVFWTLCYEVQFYLIIALWLYIFRQAWLTLLLIASIPAFMLLSNFHPVEKIFSFNYFLIGVWAFVIVFSKSHVLKLFGLLVLGAFFFRYSNISVSIGIITAVILTLTAKLSLTQGKLVRPFLFLGSISYSLYLFHDIVGQRVINLSFRFWNETTENFSLLILLALLVSFSIASFSRSHFELRLSRALKHFFEKKLLRDNNREESNKEI
jgi:peptidoglycan/LPS O-acetylase OafA/YrhL